MSTAGYAKRYCEMGLALTHLPPLEKGPRHPNWQLLENAITDPAAAFEHFTRHPDHGVAALLEHSRLVSLDVDQVELAPTVLRHFGIDLEELKAEAPCVIGRNFRLMYRAPASDLQHRSLGWPKREKPAESQTIFELRTGAKVDVLPPTIHPTTRAPYRWENPPRHGFPDLPRALLELWENWPTVHARALALCPWAPPAPVKQTTSRRREISTRRESVIAAFNESHSIGAILTAHGYRPRGARWGAPDLEQYAPGIKVLDSGRIYCHYSGHPLNTGHALDAFDLFRLLDHNGDYRTAVKAAAAALKGNH